MKPGRKPNPNIGPSPRHIQILIGIADGKQDKAIARELDIELATIKAHSYIMRKRLGAVDRAHAVAIALRRGLIA